MLIDFDKMMKNDKIDDLLNYLFCCRDDSLELKNQLGIINI